VNVLAQFCVPYGGLRALNAACGGRCHPLRLGVIETSPEVYARALPLEHGRTLMERRTQDRPFQEYPNVID